MPTDPKGIDFLAINEIAEGAVPFAKRMLRVFIQELALRRLNENSERNERAEEKDFRLLSHYGKLLTRNFRRVAFAFLLLIGVVGNFVFFKFLRWFLLFADFFHR